jgi:hypothetical protein
MTMKKSADSAKAKKYGGAASVFVAGVLAALLQLQFDHCHAQQAGSSHITYGEYVNPVYGYSICYPNNIFVPQGESISGDGQTFEAGDGAELHVHADYNVPYRSIQDDFNNTVAAENRNGIVTFKIQEDNWYVVSGVVGSRIFYRKTIQAGEEFVTFRAFYPGSANDLYADVVTALGKCLKATKAN